MVLSKKQIVHRLLFFFGCFFFVLSLTSCSDSGSAHTSPALQNITSASPIGTSSRTLKTYTGTSFSLSYPQGWQVQGSGNQVIFQDAQGLNALTVIITPNPKGTKSANTLADTTFPLVEKAILTNAQPIQAALTASVGGETWVQRGATGTLSTGGQSMPGKLIMLVVNRPAQSPATLAYEIYYGGPAATFDQKEAAVFQAMLQSFTF